MAIAFLNNIAFSGGAQAQSLRLENLATDPGTANAGQLYYDTANNIVKVYNGSSWLRIGEDYTFNVSDGVNSTPVDNNNTVTFSGTANEVSVLEDNKTITIGLPDDVTLTGELTVNGTGQSSFAGQVTIPATPVANTDAASKGYVDNLVTGGLTFKDGFNANTGAIDGGGNLTSGASRVAIEVGDYYVVTTAGNFYGDTSIPLTVGDSVICKTAAAQGASTSANWIIVQGDEGVVDLTSGNGGASTGNAITSNTNARGSVTVEAFAYAGSSNVGHVPSGGTSTTFLKGNGTWAVPEKGSTGIRINLSSGVDGVTRAEAGGITTFTLQLRSSDIFDDSTLNSFDVMAEVVGNNVDAGTTVYAEINRTSSTGVLLVKFTGSVSNSDYQIILNRIDI